MGRIRIWKTLPVCKISQHNTSYEKTNHVHWAGQCYQKLSCAAVQVPLQKKKDEKSAWCNQRFVRSLEVRIEKLVLPNFQFVFGFWGYFKGIRVQSLGVRGVWVEVGIRVWLTTKRKWRGNQIHWIESYVVCWARKLVICSLCSYPPSPTLMYLYMYLKWAQSIFGPCSWICTIFSVTSHQYG